MFSPKKWLAGLCLVGSAAIQQVSYAAPPCNASVASPNKYAVDTHNLDTQLLVDEFADDMMSADLKGYAMVILNKQGEVVASVEQGVARTDCDVDGYQPYTIHTKGGIGSVTKVVTTIALLSALEESNSYDLDTPTQSVVPYKWRANLHPRFTIPGNKQTIGQVVSHRAGFHKNGCYYDNGVKETVKNHFFHGDQPALSCYDKTPPDLGHRHYSNMVGAVAEFFGYIAHPALMENIESTYSSSSQTDYDRAVQAGSTTVFNTYVKNMFDNIGADVELCSTEPYIGKGVDYAHAFTSGEDPNGGQIGIISNELGKMNCAAGALIVSVYDLARFIHYAKNTELLISKESYAMMENGQDRHGWRYYKFLEPSGMFYHSDGFWPEGDGDISGWLASTSDGYTIAWATQTTFTDDGKGSGESRLIKAYTTARKGKMKQNAEKAISALGTVLF